MKERGMIFNGEMVRAILDGRKTQTRRIMAPQPADDIERCIFPNPEAIGWKSSLRHKHGSTTAHFCPHGKPGDLIWVRETWARYNIDQNSHDIAYRATTPADWPEEGRWRPSIHMPRWASRILLEITDVRVERLNAISEEDARAEGIIDGGCLNCGEPEPCGCANPEPDATDAFAYLWQSIYGQESWNDNPWVWVISFERIEGGAA
ncbi:ASCH domain-containing protein [Klebsiella pneumoniae]|uniref:morphogenetic protein n=1 Tax=Klebsiella pneumoniae TaxID=573 RepID=UPI001CC0CD96|nr:morphogenetic protein [Klebsiella pneumoniae]EKV4336728.1 morphogenetic protein [Klebsiella pneumoniae]MBZ1715776.1 morphogenetic protein [Klebsiella pneumoniae]MCQ8529548.1 morphogenetic protein [Klebsiella pneumoniae]MDP1036456.1 morphogenetic protein [Klebsiella pneumoniae]HBQ7851341.1 morphogenetic protein [Klebsiella pneumoniae]